MAQSYTQIKEDLNLPIGKAGIPLIDLCDFQRIASVVGSKKPCVDDIGWDVPDWFAWLTKSWGCFMQNCLALTVCRVMLSHRVTDLLKKSKNLGIQPKSM